MSSDMGTMINRRRAYGGKKLPYDAEIEYLKSDGHALIDTGYKPNNNTLLLIDVLWGSYNNFGSFCGAGNTFVKEIAFTFFNEDKLVIDRNLERVSIENIYANKRNIVSFSREFIINGTLLHTFNNREFTCLLNLILFNNYINSRRFKVSSIYSAKIYEDNVLFHDFIPVRVGNVGYMYDKVSGQLFGNAGTGSFILGQDV